MDRKNVNWNDIGVDGNLDDIGGIDDGSTHTRVCTKCYKVLPSSEFYERYAICKGCQKKNTADWKKRNKDLVSRHNHDYKVKNKEGISSYNKDYYQYQKDQKERDGVN